MPPAAVDSVMGMKKNNQTTEGTGFPVYQCALPVSRQTVEFCAGLLTRRLRQIKSPFRSRPAAKIVTLVLAMLRHDQRIFDLAGGNAISETTLRRWRDELLALLAAQAPAWTAPCGKSPAAAAKSS